VREIDRTILPVKFRTDERVFKAEHFIEEWYGQRLLREKRGKGIRFGAYV